jgi:hypothetical protein
VRIPHLFVYTQSRTNSQKIEIKSLHFFSRPGTETKHRGCVVFGCLVGPPATMAINTEDEVLMLAIESDDASFEAALDEVVTDVALSEACSSAADSKSKYSKLTDAEWMRLFSKARVALDVHELALLMAALLGENPHVFDKYDASRADVIEAFIRANTPGLKSD